jgi:hypothetical protein
MIVVEEATGYISGDEQYVNLWKVILSREAVYRKINKFDEIVSVTIQLVTSEKFHVYPKTYNLH